MDTIRPIFEVRSTTPDPAADDPADPVQRLFPCAFARTGAAQGTLFVNYGRVGIGRKPAVFDSLEAALAAIARTVAHWHMHDEVRHRRSIWPYVRDRYAWDVLQALPLHRWEGDFVVVVTALCRASPRGSCGRTRRPLRSDMAARRMPKMWNLPAPNRCDTVPSGLNREYRRHSTQIRISPRDECNRSGHSILERPRPARHADGQRT